MKSQFKKSAPWLALGLLGSLSLIIAAELLRPPTAESGVDLVDIPYYQLPFGPDAEGQERPFWPSRLQTENGRLIDPKAIQSAAACAECHPREFDEWAPSLHAIAGRDVVYEKAVETNEDLHRDGIEKARFCEGCHAPGEVLAGRTNRFKSVMPSDAETEGLTCVMCHTAIHADPVEGNGALTLAVNTGVDQLSNPMILAAPRDHSRAFGATQTNALIASSDFCGACHTENYDRSMSKAETRQHVQTTFVEWRDSWYGRNNVSCQDCHMAPDPAAYVRQIRAGNLAKPERYSHNFVGANYLMFDTALGSNLTYLRGGIPPGLTAAKNTQLIEQQGKATRALLREAAGLELRHSEIRDDQLRFSIAVQNLGAGHNLPTGVIDQKYMWLEVIVRDAEGKVLYHSGAFDAERGETDPNAVIWREDFRDAKGKRIPDHLTFLTAQITHLRRGVPPKGEDVVDYQAPLPAGSHGPLTLESRLWYRVATQEFAYNTLKIDLVIPAFELAAATFSLSQIDEVAP
ncbi:multiheme c-type cytochrome [Pseudomonas sp. sp1636]|uniref:multiheme c-type cytochrome n=1 Tax=Pseudomonas sp. sp1636 TaxID=3036707 RepID=UPI0025A5220A|nr:multiheme c-type cytochrome [Pseudomonas sp. sp1636]MDM8347414.1 multiheme c-type cytochrome [Pseudomonas sp. sp1636]